MVCVCVCVCVYVHEYACPGDGVCICLCICASSWIFFSPSVHLSQTGNVALSLSPHAVYTGRTNNFVTSLFIYHHVRAIIVFQATY